MSHPGDSTLIHAINVHAIFVNCHVISTRYYDTTDTDMNNTISSNVTITTNAINNSTNAFVSAISIGAHCYWLHARMCRTV
jgi:hypothetical protein